MVPALVDFSQKVLVARGIQDNIPLMEMLANALPICSIHLSLPIFLFQ